MTIATVTNPNYDPNAVNNGSSYAAPLGLGLVLVIIVAVIGATFNR